MTRSFFVALAALAFIAGCVLISSSDIGEECVTTSDCDDPELVCVLLDEAQPGGGSVCVPMKTITDPVACEANADCPAKTYPVDATCVDGACACAGEPFADVCGVEVMDPLTCVCVTAPDVVDAGPDVVDAGG